MTGREENLNINYLRIFRRIGCIGDSLSSGEFEYAAQGEKGYWDCYEYSWGKQIERMTGVSVTMFARGGMTAHRLYLDADAKTSTNGDINRLFDAGNTRQAYIIALGYNDLRGKDVLKVIYGDRVGTAKEDICREDYRRNAGSLTGWYAKIIQRLQSMEPDAKFFLVNMPRAEEDNGEEALARMLDDIAGTLPNCYVVDLYRNGPVYDRKLWKKYFEGGHMNALGYLATAYTVMDEMNRIIRETPEAFRFVQFIGSGYAPYE